MATVHATCVAFEGRGVLIRGPSGSGKSDLGLRAIDAGARLVADDRVTLSVRNDTIVASAPASIWGMIEIRGLGIVRLEALGEAALSLVVDLIERPTIERLPERRECDLMGLPIAWIGLAGFDASAVAKLKFVLANLGSGRMLA
jgi:serine kinase of HPr protein (carbohydrate metabolism regulator)